MNPGLDNNTVNLFSTDDAGPGRADQGSAGPMQQLTHLVKDLAVLGVQNATQTATSAAGTAAASSSGDLSGPAPMERAELHSDSTSAELCLDEHEACRDPSLECLQRGAHQLALFA